MKQNFLSFLRASESAGGRNGATMDGKPVTFAELAEHGYGSCAPRQRTAQYERTYREARRLYDQVLSGDRWAAFRFQEAMTTSDFALYFGDILDRSVLANYAETPYSWSQFAKRATIQDFRMARIFRADRGGSVLDGPILPNSYGASGSGPTGLEQVTEYPMRKRVITGYTDQLYKFGARMDYSWEAMINDDLDLLRDTPALFGRAARRTEEKRATSLFVSSTGPNSTFFSTANLNLVTTAVNPIVTTNNPPLSIASLEWAMTIMATHRDLDGEPINLEGVVLVVPPALMVTAMNIVNASQILVNERGGTTITFGTDGITSGQRLATANWASPIRVAVNYYLPVVNTTSPNTQWYLFAGPGNGRPAMQLSFLRGHEGPEMFMKAPNAIPIGEGRGAGGGSQNPFDGDFDTDAIAYKVREVLGGTLLDPIMAVASTGVGS